MAATIDANEKAPATDPEQTVQFLSADGAFKVAGAAQEYAQYLDELGDEDYKNFYSHMVRVRAFDVASANLQRQGQLALWVPSFGQEAAQVGSGFAARPQDHIFPSYREHVVGMIRGVDMVGVLGLLRGVTHGGWDPKDPKNGNFHLYTLVIGSHTLHATGYAMGLDFDGLVGTGKPEKDTAVLAYFGDGASSQGDTNEAFVFASSYQAPQVFFLQNNHWAISVPVSRQSRTPLYRRAHGFGMPGVQVDGNDVLASYAVTRKHLEDARAGRGPSLIEALTYRIGAHTSSDDPTRYRADSELADWVSRDPIERFRAWLAANGFEQKYFDEVDAEAADFARDVRARALELEAPSLEHIFDHVYSEPHPLMEQQAAWAKRYEASFEPGGIA